MADISIFGEPLIELASSQPGQVLGPCQTGIAGDTLNTAVYLSRSGQDVSYVTALGKDAYSDAIIARLAAEGVSTGQVLRHPTLVPGLYAIRTDDQGERFFTYWRAQSAAREFFSLPDARTALSKALDTRLFYFTGISLAMLPPDARETLLDAIATFAQHGGVVAFDGNYRPFGWASESETRDVFRRVAALVTVVLPTKEDDDKLFGNASAEEHGRRWQSWGTDIAIIKAGPEGAWVLDTDGSIDLVAVDTPLQPVDTTGAGDSFNAAFLAGWLDGKSPKDSARAGNELAGRVIMHRGALI